MKTPISALLRIRISLRISFRSSFRGCLRGFIRAALIGLKGLLLVSLSLQPAQADNHLLPAKPVLPEASGSADPLARSRGSWGQAYADQWGLYSIGYLHAGGVRLALPASLETVTVALIDTGVDYRHPDLPPEHLWRNPDEQADGRDNDNNGLIDDLIGWNFVGQNNRPWDDHGHGTHLAGIIAAQSGNATGIAGIAPNARLMVLKALDGAGHGNGSDIAAAIHYALDKGAQIIQLSLGGAQPNALERDAIARAVSRNVLLVVAAGNSAARIAAQGYEQLPGVMLVGSATPQRARATFSDWGTELALLAPGVDILSLRAKGSDLLWRDSAPGYQSGSAVVADKYYRASGNSFAAPFVTAAAALILGQRPQLSAAELRRTLLQSADDLGPAGPDMNHGYGLLNLAASLSADPGHFIEARLSHTEWQPGRGLLIYGQADADLFASAAISWSAASPGANPTDATAVNWQPLTTLNQPVPRGLLYRVDPTIWPSGQLITLRLSTEHRDGQRRESYLQLQMPASFGAVAPVSANGEN